MINSQVHSLSLMDKSTKKKKKFQSLINFLITPNAYYDYVLLIITFLLVISINKVNDLFYIGYLLILISLYLIVKVKSNQKLVILFAILGFVNISIAYTDIINLGLTVAEWQIPLRISIYNIISAKSLILFLSVLNLMLSRKWISESSVTSFNSMKYNYNPIITVVGIISLYLILIFGYDPSVRNSSEYISNENPLYEYAIVIFAVSWLFSGKNIYLNILLYSYSFIYILYSFYSGDRSAAFVMLLMVFILNFIHKINLSKVFLYALIALLLANFIAGFRIGVPLELEPILQNLKERGLYSDTVSYSYYASITVSALHHLDIEAPSYFWGFFKYQLFGFGINDYGNMANYVSENFKILFNRSGGLYTSSFYAWFGYIGIVLSSLILGLIIRTVFSKENNYTNLYQILIIAFALRWYLYNPTGLFRTIFVVSTLVLIASNLFNILVRKKRVLNDRNRK